MSTNAEDSKPVFDLRQLRVGDLIEARRPDTLVLYQGEVDTVAPHVGILWIRHGMFQERKMLDVSEYQLWRLPFLGPRQD